MKGRATPIVALCLVIATACSSKPDDQMNLAQKAMDQAKEQHAAEFAANEWRSAEQAWEQGKQLYAKEQYGEAGQLFVTARSRFEKARNVAKSKRDAVLRDVQNMQRTIDLRYKGLKSNLAAAEGKLPAAVKKSLDESCRDIDKAVDKLKGDVEQGDYTAAKTTAQTTIRMVYDAEKELEQAVSGKKKASDLPRLGGQKTAWGSVFLPPAERNSAFARPDGDREASCRYRARSDLPRLGGRKIARGSVFLPPAERNLSPRPGFKSSVRSCSLRENAQCVRVLPCTCRIVSDSAAPARWRWSPSSRSLCPAARRSHSTATRCPGASRRRRSRRNRRSCTS